MFPVPEKPPSNKKGAFPLLTGHNTANEGIVFNKQGERANWGARPPFANSSFILHP